MDLMPPSSRDLRIDTRVPSTSTQSESLRNGNAPPPSSSPRLKRRTTLHGRSPSSAGAQAARMLHAQQQQQYQQQHQLGGAVLSVQMMEDEDLQRSPLEQQQQHQGSDPERSALAFSSAPSSAATASEFDTGIASATVTLYDDDCYKDINRRSGQDKTASKDLDFDDSTNDIDEINIDNRGSKDNFGGGGNGKLRKSVSSRSITIKRRGCFDRLRRSPQFILFTVFLALFVDMAAYGIIVPIIPFIVSDKINGGATDTGLLLAVYAIGILVSAPLFGVLGDFFVARRTPMLIGLVGMLASTLLFMVANNFYVFLLARLLQGVAGGSVWTLGLALITDVFPADQLGLQMGKALIGYTLGLMSGPPLGGLLYERGGYRAPFIFCGAITLLDFICRAFIIEEREEIVNALREQGMSNEAMEEEAQVVARRKQERQETSSSFRNLLKSKRLIGCVLVTACNAFVFSGAEPTVPLHLASKFDLSSEKIGLVFMAFSLPTITSPLSGALSDRIGAKAVCLVSLLACGGAVIAAGFSQNSLPMIIFLFTIIGVAGTAILTPILGEISAVVRSTGTGDGFARAYAMFNMAFSVGVLVGPVVCGLIYEHFGFWAICLTMSGVLFLVTPVVILWIGGIDQKRQDLAKYKEEEKAKQSTQSASSRSLLAHSKYSIEFHQEQSLELGTRGGTSTLDLDQQRDNGN